MNPWHSNTSLSLVTLLLVRVMQANIGGCCGSKVDLLVYLSSDLAKGQNNLEEENMSGVVFSYVGIINTQAQISGQKKTP